MRQGMATGDIKLLQRSAHTLRGLLGNFGAEPAAALSRKIELQGTTGNVGTVGAQVHELERELQALDRALAAFLRTSA